MAIGLRRPEAEAETGDPRALLLGDPLAPGCFAADHDVGRARVFLSLLPPVSLGFCIYGPVFLLTPRIPYRTHLTTMLALSKLET